MPTSALLAHYPFGTAISRRLKASASAEAFFGASGTAWFRIFFREPPMLVNPRAGFRFGSEFADVVLSTVCPRDFYAPQPVHQHG
jgi:hypothetical protein